MNELSYTRWPHDLPPADWSRLLAVDVGGSTPWGWLWTAIDPWSNIIFYDELYKTTDQAPRLVDEAKPKMKDPESGEDYHFKAKVIDYENKIAAADLQRAGIQMTNARKHDKASSIERLKGYFHCNPKHHYPPWHPKAGEPGSPRAFVMARCKDLRREFPMARWLEVNGIAKNEMDRKTGNHLIDCALYTIRELPPPFELKPMPAPLAAVGDNISKISELYWYDRKQREQILKSLGVKSEKTDLDRQEEQRLALVKKLRKMSTKERIRIMSNIGLH